MERTVSYVNESLRTPEGLQARKKLFENGGADFAQGPPPCTNVAQVLKKLMSGGGGGGGTPTRFIYPSKKKNCVNFPDTG